MDDKEKGTPETFPGMSSRETTGHLLDGQEFNLQQELAPFSSQHPGQPLAQPFLVNKHMIQQLRCQLTTAI
jgi:hypothetical protein